jgi:hypothetical protein
MTGWHNGEMNVVRFILARIAEDERGQLSSMRRGARPSRGLREAAFKRRLVDDALRSVEWNFARGEDNDLHVNRPFSGSWPWSTPIILISMLVGPGDAE